MRVSPGVLDYCHPRYYRGTPNQLFLNNGDAPSATSPRSRHPLPPGKGMGVGVADFDLDGWMDIFVANDKVYNSFFHNKGGGKLKRDPSMPEWRCRRRDFISGMA